MEILYHCCAGLDVHKKSVVACLRRLGPDGQAEDLVQTFGTMTGGAVGGPNRFGYALESIAPGATYINNTIVLANLSASAIATGENSTANNNTIFGGSNALWGVFAGDGSPQGATSAWTLGTGSLANTVNAALDNAPPPPANTFAGPAIYFQTNNGTQWTPTWTPPAAATTNPVSNAPVPQSAAPPAGPTLTHTVQVMSDGSIKVISCGTRRGANLRSGIVPPTAIRRRGAARHQAADRRGKQEFAVFVPPVFGGRHMQDNSNMMQMQPRMSGETRHRREPSNSRMAYRSVLSVVLLALML